MDEYKSLWDAFFMKQPKTLIINKLYTQKSASFEALFKLMIIFKEYYC
jgi:hypothetical protein